MNYSDIEENMARRDLSHDLVNDFCEGNFLELSKTKKSKIQKNIQKHALTAKFIPTLNNIFLGLLYDRESTLDTIRRQGVLRHSKYVDKKNIATGLANKIIELSSDLSLSSNDLSYFNSVVAFAPFFDTLKNKTQQIKQRIFKFKKKPKKNRVATSLIKTLLAYIDYMFLIDYMPTQRDYPNVLSYYPKEDIAEAISYIIFLKQSIAGFVDSDTGFIDDEYILSKDFENLILDGCIIKRLQEAEILVDHFAYECKAEGKTSRIKSHTPDLEKSIRLGYIRTSLQNTYDTVMKSNIPDSIEIDKAPSLDELCTRVAELPDLNPIQYIEDYDYPRYRLGILEPVWKILAEKFLAPTALFREEIIYLSVVFKEQFLNFEKLQEIKLTESFSLLDFFRVKRFFVFMHMLWMKKIKEVGKDDPLIAYRSLVPVFIEDTVADFFARYVDEQQLHDFFELLTWDSSSNAILDLQYQPFLKIGKAYVLPLSVFVNSNSIRNIFSSEYKHGNPRVFDDGKYDPISDVLGEAFRKRGYKTFTQIKHSYKEGGDIDFLAFNDEILFVAECKNTLHPTNPYELRTVYDNLNKANSQLDLAMEALKDIEAKEAISTRIGAKIDDFEVIKTSIVMNSRLFGFSDFWSHPVRNVFEFASFLTTGTINTSEGTVLIWEDNLFSDKDILNYLRGDFPPFTVLYNSMFLKEETYQLGKHKLIFETYILDAEKVKKDLLSIGIKISI